MYPPDQSNKMCREGIGVPRGFAGGIRRRSGGSAIEFAILAPLLLIMLTGVVELGMAAYQAMQVQTAVEAGVLYAIQNGVTSPTAIGTAVTSATATPGVMATPIPLVFCGCPSYTAGVGVVSQGGNCTTACADGSTPGTYVTVNAALPHTTIMPFLKLPLPATLTASATVRVQ